MTTGSLVEVFFRRLFVLGGHSFLLEKPFEMKTLPAAAVFFCLPFILGGHS
jgi:hypothetical protein